MSWRSRARHFATVTATRGRRRLLRTSAGRRIVRPDISVVVPFYNVEQYLERCLESIRDAGVSNIEVLLVDDGSPDGSRRIAEDWVRRDKRFRLLTRPNGGLGAARNTGVRAARGRWLTFVDSDDELAPGALAELLAQARATDAQIVVGSVQRFTSAKQWTPAWVPSVHKRRRTGIEIEDFLPLLRNLYTWNKLFRRDFWDAQGLWFREGVAYEDQPIITQLFVAATSMDVIPAVVYRYRARDDGSSISQQTGTMKDLKDRVAAWRATAEALRDVSEPVRRAWLQTLFDAHFNWYLMSRGTADDDYWTLLQEVVTELLDGAPQEMWDKAPARNRVLLELTRQNRRSDLQEYVRQGALQSHGRFEAHLTDAGIDLCLPFRDDPELPDDLFLVRPDQMRLVHRLDHLHQVDDAMELSGYAFVEKVDLATHEQRVEVVLQDETSGSELVFPATTGRDESDPDNPLPEGDDWADYRPGHFSARIPLDVFATGPWHLSLRVVVGGHEVQDLVTKVLRRGPLGHPPALLLPDGARLLMDWRVAHPVRLRREGTAVVVENLRLDGRRISGRLQGAGQGAQFSAAVGSFLLHTAVAGDGTFSLDLSLPPQLSGAVAPDSVSWRLRCAGSEVVAASTDRCEATLGGHRLVAGPGRRLALAITEMSRAAEFDMVKADGEELRLAGSIAGNPDQVRVSMVSKKTRTHAYPAAVSAGRFEVAVALVHDVYRFGELPLPTGVHRVVVEALHDGEWIEVQSLNAPALVDQLPLRPAMGRLRGTIGRGATEALELSLVRPTGSGSNRQVVQSLVRRAQHRRGVADRRGILFRSYFGERATDNGVAIQAELQRRGSDLPVYWAVHDHSTPVPQGGTPVVVNTPEWFELLGSVRYYVDNMYQPDYHLKPDGQVIVQTFHGYPFKQMGLPHWRQQHFAQALIDSYHRRAGEWDYLLSPARYATPLLTRDFGYDGPTLEIGYPRNDVLQSGDAEGIREATRAALGIRPDQRVVLYAPTFRDYLARNNNQAAMSDFLDFDAIHRAFGDEVVLLMRGHAFNARAGQRVGSFGTTIDVTDYPEVSDLYLAADVCVADYSSLRFDFGVTGKPMIFLVPDLQRYVDTRGWLFDYEPTAPGPKVDTTEEVIHHLGNVDALVTDHATAYEKFRADYLDLEDGRAAARFVDAVIAPHGDA